MKVKEIVKKTYLFEKNDKKDFEEQAKELGLTKYAIAKKLKITNTYMSYILNGERAFSELILKQIRDLGFNLEVK